MSPVRAIVEVSNNNVATHGALNVARYTGLFFSSTIHWPRGSRIDFQKTRGRTLRQEVQRVGTSLGDGFRALDRSRIAQSHRCRIFWLFPTSEERRPEETVRLAIVRSKRRPARRDLRRDIPESFRPVRKNDPATRQSYEKIAKKHSDHRLDYCDRQSKIGPVGHLQRQPGSKPFGWRQISFHVRLVLGLSSWPKSDSGQY